MDKAKKTLELEYHDLEDKLNQVQSACNRALAERKKFETDAITASDELHEVKFELRNADEKVPTRILQNRSNNNLDLENFMKN